MSAHRAERGAARGGGRTWLLVVGLPLLIGMFAGLAWFSVTNQALWTPEPTAPGAAPTAVEWTDEDPPPERPKTAPVPGRDEPYAMPHPQAPPDLGAIRDKAYREAVAAKDPHPAETAFRRSTDAFVMYNRQLADAQAQQEGLTLDEVKELTYFGFLAQQSQRWPEVEEVLGQPVDDSTRAAAEQMLDELNQTFKAEMRRLVQSGGTVDERWALIRRFQARYKEAYFATTQMNEALLQDLLAGDMRRKYPMSQTPAPEQLAEQAPAPVEPEPRPAEQPPAPAESDTPTETPPPSKDAEEAPTAE